MLLHRAHSTPVRAGFQHGSGRHQRTSTLLHTHSMGGDPALNYGLYVSMAIPLFPYVICNTKHKWFLMFHGPHVSNWPPTTAQKSSPPPSEHSVTAQHMHAFLRKKKMQLSPSSQENQLTTVNRICIPVGRLRQQITNQAHRRKQVLRQINKACPSLILGLQQKRLRMKNKDAKTRIPHRLLQNVSPDYRVYI